MQAKQTCDCGWLGGKREWGECGAGYVLRCKEWFIFELHDCSWKAKCWNQGLPEEPGVVFRWKIRGEQRFIFYSERWWTIFFLQVTKEYKENHNSNLSTRAAFEEMCVLVCMWKHAPGCMHVYLRACVLVCLCVCVCVHYCNMQVTSKWLHFWGGLFEVLDVMIFKVDFWILFSLSLVSWYG